MAGVGLAADAAAQDEPTLRIGFVTFLSGPAAGPFGVPARNAAELVVEHLNEGGVPAPYDSEGIAGARIVPVIIDEAGGTAQQVAEFRNLVERQNVDLVIGYISSGDCLAVAPVAEELQTLTVFFDCGTPRIFEEAEYRYVFRTGSHATKDNVAAARYLLELQPDVRTIAGINRSLLTTLGACGDVERNVMCCPAPFRHNRLHEELQRSLVRLLDVRGVVAVGFGEGVSMDEVPPAMVEEADACRLPLFTVPYEIPFIAVTRRVSQAVFEEHYAMLRQAIDQARHITMQLSPPILQYSGLPAALERVVPLLTTGLPA